MTEQRKKDIAKEYIKEKVLNKELVDTQWSILWELNSLKQEIKSLTDFTNILWSEKPESKQKIDESKETFWLNGVMKILFNEKWNQRTKIWYEANKLLNLSGGKFVFTFICLGYPADGDKAFYDMNKFDESVVSFIK